MQFLKFYITAFCFLLAIAGGFSLVYWAVRKKKGMHPRQLKILIPFTMLGGVLGLFFLHQPLVLFFDLLTFLLETAKKLLGTEEDLPPINLLAAALGSLLTLLIFTKVTPLIKK